MTDFMEKAKKFNIVRGSEPNYYPKRNPNKMNTGESEALTDLISIINDKESYREYSSISVEKIQIGYITILEIINKLLLSEGIDKSIISDIMDYIKKRNEDVLYLLKEEEKILDKTKRLITFIDFVEHRKSYEAETETEIEIEEKD